MLNGLRNDVRALLNTYGMTVFLDTCMCMCACVHARIQWQGLRRWKMCQQAVELRQQLDMILFLLHRPACKDDVQPQQCTLSIHYLTAQGNRVWCIAWNALSGG